MELKYKHSLVELMIISLTNNITSKLLVFFNVLETHGSNLDRCTVYQQGACQVSRTTTMLDIIRCQTSPLLNPVGPENKYL